jgi:hypothetical protein
MHKILSKVTALDKWMEKHLSSNELGFGDLMYEQSEEEKKKEKDMSLWQALSFVGLFIVLAIAVEVLSRLFGYPTIFPH